MMENKQADSRLVPVFKFTNLMPGDVLLSTVRRSAVSTMIRVGTASQYSHAAIYWGKFSFLEAIDEGISNYNILIKAINDKSNIRVMRLAKEFDENRSLGQQAAGAAASYIGREYWTAGAIKSQLRRNTVPQDGRMFCSYLVAQAYEDVGVKLCPGIESQSVTPGDLSNSTLFDDVTDETTYAAKPIELHEKMALVDGNNGTSPQKEFRTAINRIMVDVRTIFHKADLQTPSSLHQAMELLICSGESSVQKEVDDKLADVLDVHGYQDFPHTIMFREIYIEPWEEQILEEIPLKNVEATLATNKALLADWMHRNADRKKGIDAYRSQYGKSPPFKTVEIQMRHEESHWRAMEECILALARNIDQIEAVFHRRRLT